jgi:glutamate synthase domain-containing protein 3
VASISTAPTLRAHLAVESITNTGQMIGNIDIHNQASVIVNGGSGNAFGRFTGGAITIANGNLAFAGGNTALGDSIVVNSGRPLPTTGSYW